MHILVAFIIFISVVSSTPSTPSTHSTHSTPSTPSTPKPPDPNQDSALQYQRSWGTDVEHFTADHLGNVYLLIKGGQLKKFTARGDSAGVFNEVRRYGKLYSMDVSNPLRIILFYKDFGTVLLLDRFLNRINVLDLRRAGILQASAVGLSYDNQLWIYDALDYKLKKLDEQGKILMETADFRQVFDEPPVPGMIEDREGFVYLYDARKGLFIFDYYGALKNRLAFLDMEDVQVQGNSMYGRKLQKLWKYVPGTLDLVEAPIPSGYENIRQLRILPQALYVLLNGQVSSYRYR